jgi:Bacterial PH domain
MSYKTPVTVVLVNFRAPWSSSLRITTTVAMLVLLGVLVVAALVGSRALMPMPLRVGLVALPVLIVLVTLPFMVRGYLLTDKEIEVQRLGWRTLLPLAGLVAVTGQPEGLHGSMRLFGNGGLFAMTGWYWNRRIGRFRAYVTDPARAVLLCYRDGRQVILSPHDVQHFIVKVRTLAGLTTH